VWQGYRESDDRTGANEIIEANIWEAGAGSDTLTLGVSFASGKKVVMNTVHIAHPAARDESAIAKGLLVQSSDEIAAYRLRLRRPSNSRLQPTARTYRCER
jgi:hypothetical protein